MCIFIQYMPNTVTRLFRYIHLHRSSCVGESLVFCHLLIAVGLPAPSTPTNLASPSQSPTSITLSWEQPAGDVVDRYDIVYTYQGGCSDYTQPENMATVIDGTAREYTLQNLQEFSDYTISVAAVNGAGSSPAATAMTATASSGK